VPLDLMSALGVSPSDAVGAPPPSAMQPSADGIPTMRVRPSAPSGGLDLMAALGVDQSDAVAPTPQTQASSVPLGKMTGWSPNIGAGIKSGVIGAISSLVDPIAGLAFTPVDQGPGKIPRTATPVADFLQSLGGSSDEVVPSTPGQQMARTAAEGAGAMVPFTAGALGESAPRTLLSLAKTGLTGAVGNLSGSAAANAVPDAAKPYAQFAGNLAGSLANEGAALGVGKAAGSIGNIAGRIGIGPKQDFGGVNATGPQILQSGADLNQALGPEGVARLQQSGAVEAQARALEAKLQEPDISDSDRVATQRQLNTLQPQREALVPGLQPTVAQIVPNQQTRGLERATAVNNNEAFAERARQNNTALSNAVQSVAPGNAGPEAVSSLFLRQLDALEQKGAAAVPAAREGVQSATEALGGQGSPADYGQAIREPLEAAQAAGKTAASRLWGAIDPDGTLALPLSGVQTAARQLLQEVQPGLGDVISSQESQILNGAASLPAVIPFRDAQRLRSNIGFAERGLRATPGNDQSLRRLGIVKSALDGDIAAAADNAASNNPSIKQRMDAALGGNAGVQQVSSGAGGRGVGETPGYGAIGSGGQDRISGAAPAGQGSAGSGGALAVGEADRVHEREPNPTDTAAAPGLAPNFGPDAAKAYAAARTATLENKQTFGQNEVGAALRPGQNGAEFRTDVANVPKTFLSSGAVEPAAVQRYINAVGGEPQAVQAMRDALVNDLREKGIIQPDGTLDPRKFTGWQRQRARTIAMFPGLGDGLENARQAQITLDRTIADHTQAVRDFQNGAARNFLRADPQVAMDRVFQSGNPAATARELYNMVKNDPDALAGLKRGAVNYLDNKFHFNENPEETGNTIKSQSFRNALPQLRPALKVIFGGQGMQNIEMVDAALKRAAVAQQKEATTGSNTVQKALAAVGHHGPAAAGGIGTTLFALIGEHLAQHVTGLFGGEGAMAAVAGGAGIVGGLWLNSLRQAGIRTMNDLSREMMLHPDLARELLRRVDAQKGVSALMQKKVAAAIQGAIAADLSTSHQKAAQ
jgi:hypothetical protein